MNTFNFTTFLTSNIDIERQYLDKLLDSCKVKQVAKGEYLVRVGEHCHHSFFVEKGLLRQFSIDDKGKEHIIQFAPENWFVTDRESVYFDQPSKFFIQAVEDSTVLFLEEHFIAALAREDQAFADFNNRLLHNHIRHLQKRINLLLSASAEERYLDFVKTYPDVLLRVPQTMVASYLGITPESLSRVRKELASRY
ncbi:cAMP-binding protein [Fulvivirga imtechensis AK7]|uniref:cAMP-binding protein n=1 Tax=Fulvivirga imtechensis AK7 TaxID=1237149 RepID=L8JKZ2_9BACT|nr:Crp/Fnr family transcriptional regulator [Fulvivirga imtechensis]ELR68888.1 cAMP-binding protein [Fulvivirga imtechensis AK7]